MKITKSRLKQLIEEEMKEVLSEASRPVQFQKSPEWQKVLGGLENVLNSNGFSLESKGGHLRGALYIYRKDFDDGSKMRLKIQEDLR